MANIRFIFILSDVKKQTCPSQVPKDDTFAKGDVIYLDVLPVKIYT